MHNVASIPQEQLLDQQTGFIAPEFHADAYHTLRQGETIDISQYDPLLTAEQASAAVGFPVGALQAVVRLPYKYSYFATGETPEELQGDNRFASFLREDNDELTRRMNDVTVYCFKAPQVGGRHRRVGQPEYYLMGLEQIKQYREQTLYGPSSLPETSGGAISLARGQSLAIGRGDASWLPNVGWDYPLLKTHDNTLRDRFSAVSHHQALAWVNEQGQLLVQRDERSREHHGPTMFIGVGRVRR